MKYNPDVHHRKSIRIKECNYAKKGMYFITICVQNRECLLSNIENEEVVLKNYGKVVEQEIKRTEEIRKNIKIQDYVIMPNHIHMIIEICYEGTKHRAPTIENFQKPTKNSIPTIIRSLKASITMKIGKIFQKNYYEHIIRNENEYYQILKYIQENPQKWKFDKLYKNTPN